MSAAIDLAERAPDPPAVPPLLRAAAVAVLLDTRVEHVLTMGRRGSLPVVHVGRHVRFRMADVLAFIERGGVPAPPSVRTPAVAVVHDSRPPRGRRRVHRGGME
jgi:excisionase family DNA binding protein